MASSSKLFPWNSAQFSAGGRRFHESLLRELTKRAPDPAAAPSYGLGPTLPAKGSEPSDSERATTYPFCRARRDRNVTLASSALTLTMKRPRRFPIQTSVS